jgi:hypothetical protein
MVDETNPTPFLLIPTTFEGVEASTKEAVSMFISRIIDSPETSYFLINGKSFCKKSNYYEEKSVEQHVGETITNFLDFLYNNKVIGQGIEEYAFRQLSRAAGIGIVDDKTREDPDYVQGCNRELLINKFLRKGTIEPERFASNGYRLSDFAEDTDKLSIKPDRARKFFSLLEEKKQEKVTVTMRPYHLAPEVVEATAKETFIDRAPKPRTSSWVGIIEDEDNKAQEEDSGRV